MKKFDFGIITPSYAPDFERCKLLCWSIEKFVSPPVAHYIIVDQRDLPLFLQLKGPNTEIITKESILPWWIKRLPFVNNVWLSLKTIPLRGWLLQQIVKIATALYIDEDVSVFVDSDVVFVRPFNFQSLVREDQVRLYDEPNGNFIGMPLHFKWHQSASRLLGLPPIDMPAPDYIDHLITWRRDNVLKLCQHIESVSGRGWMETLTSSWHLSEYILYGTFIDHVLKEQSGHYCDAQKLCHDYWSTLSMSDEQLQNFIAEIQPEHVAVMISAKANMSVQQYQNLLKLIPKT